MCSAFASLVDILCSNNKNLCNNCKIKKHGSQIKKKNNKYQNLNFKALDDSNISHDEFASVNNMLKEYDDMKE